MTTEHDANEPTHLAKPSGSAHAAGTALQLIGAAVLFFSGVATLMGAGHSILATFLGLGLAVVGMVLRKGAPRER